MLENGNPFNPVDVLEFVEKEGIAKMVFDTAHFWRCFAKVEEREGVWAKFKTRAGKSKTPVYWHFNHDNGDHVVMRKSKLTKSGFVNRYEFWLARVCEFMGPRVRKGQDQVCFEEPRKVRINVSRRGMKALKRGVERSIMSVRRLGGLG